MSDFQIDQTAVGQGNNTSSRHTVLTQKNNDECYTCVDDIFDELSYWADLGKLKDKRIICPCDFDARDGKYQIEIDCKNNNKDEIEAILKDKLTCNFVKVLYANAEQWQIKSITASGYNPTTDEGIKFQEVDYLKYDICITNPPFSCYRKFMKSIVGKIDFIVLAPYINRGNPSVGYYLTKGEAFLGHGVELRASFYNPTQDGKNNTKGVACDWISSFPDAQIERNNNHYSTGVKFHPDNYEVMPNMIMKDGTEVIRVGRSNYPDDYYGWMFGSASILNRLDQSQYDYFVTSAKRYYNKERPDLNPFKDNITDKIYTLSNGKNGFNGILFRKKQN